MTTSADVMSDLLSCWKLALADASGGVSSHDPQNDQSRALSMLREADVSFTCGPVKPIDSPHQHNGRHAGGFVAEMTYDRRVEEAILTGGFRIQDDAGSSFEIVANLRSDPTRQFLGHSNGRLVIALDTGIKFRDRGGRDGSVGYVVLIPSEPRVLVISSGGSWPSLGRKLRQQFRIIVQRLVAFASEWLAIDPNSAPARRKAISLLFTEPWEIDKHHFGHYVWNCLGQMNRLSLCDALQEIKGVYRHSVVPRYIPIENERALIDGGFREKYEIISDDEIRERTETELILRCHGAQICVDLAKRLKSILPSPRLKGQCKISVEVRVGRREMLNQEEIYIAALLELKQQHQDLQVVLDGLCPETMVGRGDNHQLEQGSVIAARLMNRLVATGKFQASEILSIHGESQILQLAELQDCVLSVASVGGGQTKCYWLLQNPCFMVSNRSNLQLHTENERRFGDYPWLRDEAGVDRGWSFTGAYTQKDLDQLAPVYIMPPKYCSDSEGVRAPFEVDPDVFVKEVHSAFERALRLRPQRDSLQLETSKKW